MKLFTEKDVQWGWACDKDCGSVFVDKDDLANDPLEWQRQALQQTASGYGKKLTTPHKINYCGKMFRVYATCYSNVASCWFKTKGKMIFVN